MRLSVFLILLIALSSADDSKNFYKVNLDPIIVNRAVYNKYISCITGRESCAGQPKLLKGILPEALANGCKRCTQHQKDGAVKLIKYMMKNKPSDWSELMKIHDSLGVYRRKYQEDAKKRGITFTKI